MKIFLVGYPLSGKTSIGKEIAKVKKCEYLGTGSYARSLGMKFEPSIRSKDYSEKFNDAIEEKVWDTIRKGDCVIDGYPRSLDQITKLLSITDKRVIYCYANPIVIANRLKRRSLAEGRAEDTDEIVADRIKASMELKKLLEQYLVIETLDTSNPRAVSAFWGTI